MANMELIKVKLELIAAQAKSLSKDRHPYASDIRQFADSTQKALSDIEQAMWGMDASDR